MEGIRMYKEKQKVGFGMNYTQSRELKENNRIYREMESIYHEICVKAGISDTDFIVLYSMKTVAARGKSQNSILSVGR